MYKLVRRPPCWNSTARLARHARLDLLDCLDKVERVESSRAKWNLGYSGQLSLLHVRNNYNPKEIKLKRTKWENLTVFKYGDHIQVKRQSWFVSEFCLS